MGKREVYPQITQISQMKSDRGDPQTYAIIGAAMAVHATLGAGFLEAVYREALTIEFEARAVPFRREAPLKIAYREKILSASYRADFVCFESVVVETKALTRLSTPEEAQIINYLKASRLDRGLLLNFGTTSLEYRRFSISKINLRSSV